MKTVTIIYELMERIYIPDLECYGIVISISITAISIEYQVRYFHDGVHETAYLFDWELTKSK